MQTRTTLEKFKAAGLMFSYCESGVYPQIPTVADVLFVLRLAREPNGYYFGVGNASDYAANIVLAAAAIAEEVLSMPYDLVKMRPIIAKAIIALSPPEAHGCTAFEEAERIVSSVPA